MEKLKHQWKERVFAAVVKAAEESGIDTTALSADALTISTPPKPEMGDLAFPLFPYAKAFRKAPPVIAEQVRTVLIASGADEAAVNAAGPYLNIKINLEETAGNVLQQVASQGDSYGNGAAMEGVKIMVEFSCPNTNKPLHLGHLRNDALGESVSRILQANGAEVKKVNLINDRGIHICKSMLAYQKFGNGETPESSGIKSDHLVGKYYVKFNQWSKEDPTADEQARKMLVAWEAGDPEVRELWETMNHWAISGIQETYDTTHIKFDKFYFESATFSRGKEEVLKGLEEGVFYKDDSGAVLIDLEEIHLDKKVLLRSDGTSIYLTQDIGTAIARHEDWPFRRLIYVVGSEQQYHFKVLFHVLKKLGFTWAENLHHLSYGMVNLPEGKMKSREGTVVDADDLIAQMIALAKQEILQKGREDEVEDVDATAAQVALGALHYFLLQTQPQKDMVFNPKESISFNGNTGPYLQYMGARISSVLRKFESEKNSGQGGALRPELLTLDEERELVKLVIEFPEKVKEAGEGYNPSLLAGYLYDLAKLFSKYYHDNSLLHNEDLDLVVTRVSLAAAVRQVLKNALPMLGIPFLEKM